jgi:hypothetical protein
LGGGLPFPSLLNTKFNQPIDSSNGERTKPSAEFTPELILLYFLLKAMRPFSHQSKNAEKLPPAYIEYKMSNVQIFLAHLPI